MGWVKQVKAPHQCNLWTAQHTAYFSRLQAGSIWQCDDCGKTYRWDGSRLSANPYAPGVLDKRDEEWWERWL